MRADDVSMKNERISVIVPVYNAGYYLEPCVRSLRNQSYDSLEIILVDDGSTDGSGKLCDSLAETDRRIRVIHQANQGQGAARNAGIQTALGEWIVFADSDDLVLPVYVSHLYELAAQNHAEIAVTSCRKEADSADLEGLLRRPAGKGDSAAEVFTSEDAICRMWYQKEISNSPCAKIFHRRLWEHQMFPAGIIYEDLAVMYRLFAETDRVVYASYQDYIYRLRADSTMTSCYNARKMDRVRVSRQLLDWSEDKSAALRRAAEERFFLSNVQVLREIPYDRSRYGRELQTLRSNIRATRRSVLTNPEVKRSNRAIAAASFLGMPFLKWLGNCYSKARRLLRHY